MRLKDIERQAIVDTVVKCKGNISWAAKVLGIARETLYRKMRVYDIKRVELPANSRIIPIGEHEQI